MMHHDSPEKAPLHGVIAYHHSNTVVEEVGRANRCYVRVNRCEEERTVAKLL
jgi:hypothetical protein